MAYSQMFSEAETRAWMSRSGMTKVLSIFRQRVDIQTLHRARDRLVGERTLWEAAMKREVAFSSGRPASAR
jgi:hypothetical protein